MLLALVQVCFLGSLSNFILSCQSLSSLFSLVACSFILFSMMFRTGLSLPQSSMTISFTGRYSQLSMLNLRGSGRSLTAQNMDICIIFSVFELTIEILL